MADRELLRGHLLGGVGPLQHPNQVNRVAALPWGWQPGTTTFSDAF